MRVRVCYVRTSAAPLTNSLIRVSQHSRPTICIRRKTKASPANQKVAWLSTGDQSERSNSTWPPGTLLMTPSRPVCLYHVRLPSPSPSPSLLSPSLSRVIFRLVRSPDTRWHVSISRLFTSIVICFTVCVLAWRDTNCSRRRRTLFRQTLGNQSMRLHLYRKCECLKALSYQGISTRQLKAVALFVFGQNV